MESSRQISCCAHSRRALPGHSYEQFAFERAANFGAAVVSTFIMLDGAQQGHFSRNRALWRAAYCLLWREPMGRREHCLSVCDT